MIEPAELTSELLDIPFIGRSLTKIQPAISSFSAGAFRQQPALSDNPETKETSCLSIIPNGEVSKPQFFFLHL